MHLMSKLHSRGLGLLEGGLQGLKRLTDSLEGILHALHLALHPLGVMLQPLLSVLSGTLQPTPLISSLPLPLWVMAWYPPQIKPPCLHLLLLLWLLLLWLLLLWLSRDVVFSGKLNSTACLGCG